MPARRKSLLEGKYIPPSNGLYIHSSPPKVLHQIGPAHIKQLLRSGDVEKMEQVVYEGHGKRLINEYSPDYKTRMFLKTIPTLMTQIGLLHDAVNSGNLEELKSILDNNKEKKRKLVLAKDENGIGLLHKAVYYDIKDIYKYLIEKFPSTVSQKDTEGRTPYHYSAACKNSALVQRMLINAGADSSILDSRQHSAKYYMNHPQELELPSYENTSRKSTANKEGLNFKKSNIRIWIHQRSLSNLQQVVWEGHGAKLLPEHSNNAKIKKFLDAVPHIMCLVKDIHADVINGDLESLKLRNGKSSTIPPIIFYGKDVNGLTPLHKASGLGRYEIAEYLVEKCPKSLNTMDVEGKTPLHYSSLLKDDGKMADMLIEKGADESALDFKQKTAAYYKTRSLELDSKFLKVIPDCPRTSKGEIYLSNWDWSLLNMEEKIEKKNKNIADKNEDVVEKLHEKVQDAKEENQNGFSNEIEKMVNNGEFIQLNEEIEYKNDEEDVNNNGEEISTKKTVEIDEENHEKSQITADETNEAITEDKQEEHDQVVRENLKNSRPSSTASTKPMTGSQDLDSNKYTTSENVDDDLEYESVIEGVVHGENEIELLDKDGTDGNEQEKLNVDALIASGNMEKLAGLVLNGKGDLLVGRESDNNELKAFLNNVPVYMDKINKIHLAAKSGSLRDLQAALDRRKFAIAKDAVSPNGASPLHVAIIFGNTNIVRYLAGRFPETLQEIDFDGRTPLHYAATIADNSHYYNLLIHLGSDMKAHDKLGHSPDYYKSNQSEMSHKILLEKFGETDLLKENDQDEKVVDMPFFATEEGRYLASSLGDPLIKGLTEVANKRPDDPIAYLATYLYNFASNKNKARPKTQEKLQQEVTETAKESNDVMPATIDVQVTVDEPTEDNEADEESAFNSTSRDEHGQSMLHFAAARAHGRNALFQLLIETEINVAYRDELYRTARDISIQANFAENTVEIDRYVLHIATRGDTDKLVELLLDGYEHITDLIDEDNTPIFEAVSKENQQDTLSFLQSILTFEEKRERVHHAIRKGSIGDLMELLADENDTGSGKLLAVGKNTYGRCSLHIAVLWQQEEIVDYLANTFPDTLRLGDNLERTALHYAMGVEKMETISKVLIKAGSKRIAKDLKGRQPTYYFLNKIDIVKLQEEEETF